MDYDELKIPPQNLDAERGVLGSLFLAAHALDEIEYLKADHFYAPAHQKIFSALCGLRGKDVAVDVVTFVEELMRLDQFEEIGGAGYLAEIMDAVPHAAHVRHYASTVFRCYQQRSMIYACTEILADSYVVKDQSDWDASRAGAEQKILGLREDIQDESTAISDIVEASMRELDSTIRGDGHSLSTGFQDLDAQVGFIKPQEVIVLAARPSMGKTSLVCNMVVKVAQLGVTPLVFSLEQSRTELGSRLLSSMAFVNGHSMRVGNVDGQERDRLFKAAVELSALPIEIDARPAMTVGRMAAVARRMNRKSPIGIIIIDYLQLIEPEDKRVVREQQVAVISRSLKVLAKELNVPIIVLAQLNRDVEKREDKRPKLSDLRESGSIEQDADMVMFLHRPDQYNVDDRPGLAEVVVAKHRGGATGIVKLTWRKKFMRFEDYSPIDDSFMVDR